MEFKEYSTIYNSPFLVCFQGCASCTEIGENHGEITLHKVISLFCFDLTGVFTVFHKY